MNSEPRSNVLSSAVAEALPSAAESRDINPMALFMVRDQANSPQREYLSHPVTLEKTTHWLDIVSSLSDRFREAHDAAMQKAVSIAQYPSEDARKTAARESQLVMAASLVVAWSFPQPCTRENVVEFLREAPQVYNMILRVSDENERFFKGA